MEETNKNQHLVDYLIKELSYDEASALRVVEEVVQAQKQTRLEHIQKYLNNVVIVNIGELKVDAFVHDVKVTADGIQYQVKPVAGSGTTWVKNFQIK